MALDGLWVDGVQQKFRPEDILDGDISAYTEPLVDAIETWMDENIEPGAAAVIDKTLTIEGATADAKVVGDKLTGVKRELTDLGLSVVDGAINITYEEVSA